jgi:hypothetical protein
MATRYEQIIANVQSMINQSAPMTDIDGYLGTQGLTPAQFRKLVEGPTIGGQAKEFFKGIPAGAVGLLETAGVGAAAMLPEGYEEPTRKFIQEKGAALRKPFAPEMGYEETIPRKFGEAVGSTIPFFATGPFGLAGRAAAVGTGAAAGAGEARLAAEEKGVTGDDRALATALGAPVGLLDLVAPQLNIGKKLITRAAVTGGVEGATEAAQKVAQNLIAQGIYNPEQPLFAGAAEEGAYGAGAGALTRFLMDAALGRKARGAPGTQPPSTEAPGAVGVPAEARQFPLGQVPEFGEGYEGYRAAPEPFREAEEKEAARQNRLFQITELRDQHDVLMREVDRLKTQFEAAPTEEQRGAILGRANELNAARADLETQIKQLSKGLEGAERAGAVAEPGQMGLDFDMPEMPRQQTGEGVVLGEEQVAPAGITPEQSEFFRQQRIADINARLTAGELITDADRAFLQMDAREQRAAFEERPTPELALPEERDQFRLGPQYIQPAPTMEEAVETRPVTEADFKVMGIAKTNKKLREAILDKDLADPAQRAEVQEVLTDFANDPNRSARIIEGVNKFLSNPVFMEQGELDLRLPRKPRAKKAKEAADVIQPTESVEPAVEPSVAVADERGAAPAGGVAAPVTGGMDVTGGVAQQPDVGAGGQPTTLEGAPREPVPPAVSPTAAPALEAPAAPTPAEGKVTPKEATRRLVQEGKVKPAEAKGIVEDITDGFGEVSTADIEEQIRSLKGETAPKVPYTPEQRATAEQHAKDLGGEIAWQEGEFALIRGYSALTGRPVYAAAKGSLRTKIDIESFTGNLFTPQERARLVAEKKRQEQAAEQAHKTKPFITFTKGKIQTSKNTPKELGSIVAGWSKLLGIRANIYITTMEDARADVGKFTGPYRAIGSAALDPLNAGSMRRMSNGDYYIAFTPSTSKTSMLEVLAHELGHVHMKEMYNNASPELQASIQKAFQKWLGEQKGKTARELVDALRARTAAKQTRVAEGLMADELKPYWRSFDEWYADQVSRWATTDEKPISVVEKFFARLGRALRSFFGNLKNNRYLPDETFVQYLKEVKKASVKPTADVQAGDAKSMVRGMIDTATTNFKKWFGNSKIVTSRDVGPVSGDMIMRRMGIPEQERKEYWGGLSQEERDRLTEEYRNRDGVGKPKVMYHGTARDISEFRPKQANAIFLTDDPLFAESFSSSSEDYMLKELRAKLSEAQLNELYDKADAIAAREDTSPIDEFNNLLSELLPSRANIVPVYVSAQNPFDFQKRSHLNKLAEIIGDEDLMNDVMYGEWEAIESATVQEAIKYLGHDGFYVQEGGRKNLAVYEPTQIKSIFNTGAWSPTDSRISYQRKSAEGELTTEGQRAAALNERMKGIANEPEPDVDQTFLDRLTLMSEKSKGIPMAIRQAVVDKDAPVKEKLVAAYQNKVTNSLGEIRGDILNEQAQEATGVADQLMKRGGIRVGADGLYEVYDRVENGQSISLDGVFEIIIEKLGAKLGSAKEAVTLSHRAFIAQRANEINKRNELLRSQAETAEAKGNKQAAAKLRKQIVNVRASQAEIDAGLEAMNTFPELKQAFDVFTKYNEGIIDFMVSTGRLSPAQAQDWKDNVGYVPWTRVEEDTNKLESANKLRTGNVHLTELPKLDTAGSSKEIRNVLDNMVGNTIWAIRSGLKNRAAVKTLEQLPDAEELKTQDEVDRELKNNKQLVVFAYRDGERVAFRVQNQEDVAAFSSVVDVAGPVMKAFTTAATGLRSFVTHMPTFALSQLAQDTGRAMFLSGVKHPFALPSKVLSNFYHVVTGGETDIQALGITGAYDGMPDHAMRRARERHGLQERNAFLRAWDKLEDFSLAADMAVRAAIYDQTMKETGDRVLAFHRAKEYINFKTGGNGQTVRILRQIVPFMNAYIQGMDVLYRTIQGKGLSMEDRKTAMALFYTTGAKVAALSFLYAALVGDDDDYKGLDDYERDKNFIIPGTGLKLPVAPEIGFLFKVLPERLYQAIAREGTERPVDAKTFMRSMRDAAINAYGGVNLTPQLIKPAIEVATNYSFFTNNPIVGINMAGKETYLQFNNSTSELAKLFGHIGISPMKVDHLLRGYLGTVGGVALDVTDAVADPNRMNKPINKLPLIKTFMYDDTGRGYKTEFYQFREDVDKVVNSVNTFKREGRAEELQEYLTEDKLKLYSMKGVVNKIEEQLGNMRKYRNIIANDPDLTPEEKREKTDSILALERQLLTNYNIPKLKQIAGY